MVDWNNKEEVRAYHREYHKQWRERNKQHFQDYQRAYKHKMKHQSDFDNHLEKLKKDLAKLEKQQEELKRKVGLKTAHVKILEKAKLKIP